MIFHYQLNIEYPICVSDFMISVLLVPAIKDKIGEINSSDNCAYA